MNWILAILLFSTVVGWIITAIKLLKLKSVSQDNATRLDHLHKAMLATGAGFFLHNVESHQSDWDERTREIFGIPGASNLIAPDTWENTLLQDERAQRVAYMEAALYGDLTFFNHSYQIVLPTGKRRWVTGTGFIIRDKHGKPIDVTGFHFDITEKKEYENTLKKEKQAAEEAMDAKTRFLANMSHEIRTPMNVISGILELFTTEKLNKTQQVFLNTLQNSSSVLIRIINDILDVTKMEAGKFTLENSPFNLRDVLGQCLSIYTQESETQNILLVGYIDSSLPDTINGDSARFQQVIINMLSNAFKFTESGHIIVYVSAEQGKIKVRITDTGIGISAESLPILFDRFQQADSTTTRKYGGTGLGLSIAKEITRLWGGDLHVDSKLGEGTTFWFYMPLKEDLVTQIKQPGKVLLCSRFQQIADLWRCDASAPEMIWVKNADEFQTQFNQQNFSHIIVEQRAVGSLGSELIAWAKSQQPNVTSTLFGYEKYALSVSDQPSVDNYCAKPFIVNQLWPNKFGSTFNSKLSTNATTWPNFGHISVLCVDDNKSNLMVLAGLLRRFNIQVTRAESGAKALEAIRLKAFDLVFMDFEMPGMNGPETTKLMLQQGNQLVVCLSAHVGEPFDSIARSSGMKDILSKPVKMATLTQLLEKYFQPAIDQTAIDQPENDQ